MFFPCWESREVYLALFHGVRRVAADCAGQAPRRERTALASRPELPVLKRWLQNWIAVRHREAAERTLLAAVAAEASPLALADLMVAAGTERTFADDGHALDFINKAFECLDLIGFDHAAELLPSLLRVLASGQGAEESTAWRSPSISSSYARRAPGSWRAPSARSPGDPGRIMPPLRTDCSAMIRSRSSAHLRPRCGPEHRLQTSVARWPTRPPFVSRGLATPTSTATGKPPTTSSPTPTLSTNY